MSYGQDPEDSISSQSFQRHTVYFEALGNAWYYSVNYDYVFGRVDNVAISGRLGYGYYSEKFEYDTEYPEQVHSFPTELNILVGKKTTFSKLD
jgi:hypothetical protein